MRTTLKTFATVAAAIVVIALQPDPAASSTSGWATGARPGPKAIYNMVTNECVDIPNFGPGTIDGPVLQYYCNLTNSDNQLFYLDYAGTNSSSRTLYTIRNVKDGLCLDVPGFERVSAGTLVSEYHCDRSSRDNQAFYLGSNGWIVNDKSELCLDVDGVRSGGPGARITLYHCRLDDDHRWKIIDGVA